MSRTAGPSEVLDGAVTHASFFVSVERVMPAVHEEQVPTDVNARLVRFDGSVPRST